MLKKFILSLFMLLSLQSNAIVGLMADDDSTAIVGLAFMDISQIVVVDTTVYRTRRSRFAYRTVRVITYVPLFMAGLFLLDEEGKVSVNEISADQAEKVGITSLELEAFNNEIEEINIVKDMVAAELADVKGSEVERAEASAKIWENYRTSLSDDAFVALVKLVQSSLN
jgi:hypothetical protein